MTAKEKAEEIFNIHYSILLDADSDISQEITISLLAKKMALVTINQMIELNGEYYLQNKESKMDYSCYCKVNGWLFEIKQEIEKL